MPRDSGVIRKRTYTDRRFYPQRAKEWIPQGLLVSLLVSVTCSFTCVDTAHICCHAVRAVYVCENAAGFCPTLTVTLAARCVPFVALCSSCCFMTLSILALIQRRLPCGRPFVGLMCPLCFTNNDL